MTIWNNTPTSIGLHAGAAVLCLTLHQRIQANAKVRPLSDPQVAGLATPGGFKLFGFVVYPVRKTTEL